MTYAAPLSMRFHQPVSSVRVSTLVAAAMALFLMDCGGASDGTGGLDSMQSGGVAGAGVGGTGGQGSGSTSCRSTSDQGGNAVAGTVGDRLPKIEAISVDVNRSDGFSSPERSDVWTIDVATGAVTLNGGTPIAASASQVQELVAAIATSGYRSRPACCTYEYVDGYPNSPIIQVRGAGTTYAVGVGDSPCWLTWNAFQGDVIGCTDFAAIYKLLEALAPTGEPFTCRSYL
jgi:hypothetical protein